MDRAPVQTPTWRTNARLWSRTSRRYVYLALWVPNGLIVGCESLFVSYAPRHAGLLFALAAFGMLIGDTLTGRVVPGRWRERLGAPLRLLLAAPYLIFLLHPALPLAVAWIAIQALVAAQLGMRLGARIGEGLRERALGGFPAIVGDRAGVHRRWLAGAHNDRPFRDANQRRHRLADDVGRR